MYDVPRHQPTSQHLLHHSITNAARRSQSKRGGVRAKGVGAGPGVGQGQGWGRAKSSSQSQHQHISESLQSRKLKVSENNTQKQNEWNIDTIEGKYCNSSLMQVPGNGSHLIGQCPNDLLTNDTLEGLTH